ncbi:MAG: FtsX-like permease family protein [Candidatus Cloacimonadota bacterium]|nr:FtsX-like permease family protein [Candidatus Cloacimonadota bacterium]
MISLIKIAWRNLWRNKRRTLITLASVLFAVLFALIMRSLQLGTYGSMEKNAVSLFTGYIQIHANGYWENKSINKTFANSDKIEQQIQSVSAVSQIAPRLESFALGSSGNRTKGVVVVGTNPVWENNFTKLKSRVVKGKYLTENDQGILVAEDLAKYLKVTVGDTLVLLGQGYHGMTAAGAYPVNGIIRFPTPQLNRQMVYMTLPNAQYFYAATNQLTSIAMMIYQPRKINKTVSELQTKIGKDYEVMSWKKMMPGFVQEIQSDNAGGLFMLGILYIVIAFGIFGTILMMTMERKREFAVMIAVGMQRGRLAFIVFVETIFLGLLGILSGIIVSLPILIYAYHHPIQLTGQAAEAMTQFGAEPIMPFALRLDFYANQSLTVMILTVIAVLYPLIIINRLTVIEGLRGK